MLPLHCLLWTSKCQLNYSIMIEFIIPDWLQYYGVKIEENLHSHIVFFVMNFLNYMACSRKTTFKIYEKYMQGRVLQSFEFVNGQGFISRYQLKIWFLKNCPSSMSMEIFKAANFWVHSVKLLVYIFRFPEMI